MKKYTIGEIYRLGLLKNHNGEPYKDKATVSRQLQNQVHSEKNTPFGTAKMYSQKIIDNLNARWSSFN